MLIKPKVEIGEKKSFYISIFAIDSLHHGLVAKAVHQSFVYHSIGVRVLRFALRHVCQDIVAEVEVLRKEDLKIYQLWVITQGDWSVVHYGLFYRFVFANIQSR